MPALIAIMIFVVVAAGAFAAGSLLDQRSARARLLRDRLASVQKPAEREPSEDLALVRDQMSPAAGVLQKTVIEPFSVADPVAGQVKSDPRNYDQIGFVRLMVVPGRTRFKNTKRPFLQRLNPFNMAEHHLMPADRGIQYPFPRLKRSGQNHPRICFVMGRRIQRNAFGTGILIKREQIELCRAA